MKIKERKRLGDLLFEANVISQEQLQKALKTQKESGQKLGDVLVNNNFTTEEDIISAIGFQMGLNRIYLYRVKPDEKLMKIVPESIVRRHEIFPVEIKDNKLVAAMNDPMNIVGVQELEMAVGMEVEIVITTRREIEAAIHRFYGLSEDIMGVYGEALENENLNFFNLDQGAGTKAEDAPVIKAVNTILQQAVKEGASDIHIEPTERDLRVRIRVDGVLKEIMNLSKNIHPPMISRLKIMSEMDISEKRLPQDGRIQIKSQTRNIDLRVSSLPSIFGEKMVIRILDKENQVLSLEDLGFRSNILKGFQKIIEAPYGMILLTGPTGSGKTTTLYAALSAINDAGKNIVTIEDPVEYVLPGIVQVQTNPKAGLTFVHGLRSILRQDPDIIMVGEIRDKETATIAVRAATTGHLVFTTLHTNDAAGALTRLVDMEIEPFLVASSVIGILAQRLVRKNCPHCLEEYEVLPGAKERIFLKVPDDEPLFLKRSSGCSRCSFLGYKGRVALHELLIVNSSIRFEILAKASAENIRDAALAQGMESMYIDAVQKVKQGLTTIQEVLRVTYADEGR